MDPWPLSKVRARHPPSAAALRMHIWKTLTETPMPQEHGASLELGCHADERLDPVDLSAPLGRCAGRASLYKTPPEPARLSSIRSKHNTTTQVAHLAASGVGLTGQEPVPVELTLCDRSTTTTRDRDLTWWGMGSRVTTGVRGCGRAQGERSKGWKAHWSNYNPWSIFVVHEYIRGNS